MQDYNAFVTTAQEKLSADESAIKIEAMQDLVMHVVEKYLFNMVSVCSSSNYHSAERFFEHGMRLQRLLDFSEIRLLQGVKLSAFILELSDEQKSAVFACHAKRQLFIPALRWFISIDDKQLKHWQLLRHIVDATNNHLQIPNKQPVQALLVMCCRKILALSQAEGSSNFSLMQRCRNQLAIYQAQLVATDTLSILFVAVDNLFKALMKIKLPLRHAFYLLPEFIAEKYQNHIETNGFFASAAKYYNVILSHSNNMTVSALRSMVANHVKSAYKKNLNELPQYLQVGHDGAAIPIGVASGVNENPNTLEDYVNGIQADNVWADVLAMAIIAKQWNIAILLFDGTNLGVINSEATTNKRYTMCLQVNKKNKFSLVVLNKPGRHYVGSFFKTAGLKGAARVMPITSLSLTPSL